MKATGIVRRIDDLGRVVIPKEIRRTMRIREGEPLEIFTDAGGSVIFKKYSPVGEMSTFAAQMCEAMHKTCGHACAVCDRDGVIAAGGGVRREIDGRPLSTELEQAMSSRQMTHSEGGLPITPTAPHIRASAVQPIIAGGDLCGCVALVAGDLPVGETEQKLMQLAALFLAKQMED